MQIIRPRWLDLILIAAIAQLALYIKFESSVSPGSPWSGLWPNAVVDMFSIWLTARVIQGLLDLSRKRRGVYGGFRSNLNFINGHMCDLLPNADSFRLRILRDEMRWLKLRLESQGKFLRKRHRTRIAGAVDRIDLTLQLGHEFRSFRREVFRCDRRVRAEFHISQKKIPETPPLHDALWLRDLPAEVREFGQDSGDDSAQLQVYIEEARIESARLPGTDDLKHAIGCYLTAIQGMVTRHDAVRVRVEEFTQFVRDNEISLLDVIID